MVPLYYCTFTLMSVVGAAIIYDELSCTTFSGGMLFFGGCIFAVLGA